MIQSVDNIQLWKYDAGKADKFASTTAAKSIKASATLLFLLSEPFLSLLSEYRNLRRREGRKNKEDRIQSAKFEEEQEKQSERQINAGMAHKGGTQWWKLARKPSVSAAVHNV